jgi:hypothetical protein
MFASVRTHLVCRLSALLAAFALSGALPLVEAHAGEHAHACRCHHAPGEECTCAGCRRAAAKARRAELDALPPCHRAAAEAALAQDERVPPGAVDFVKGCCGGPEGDPAVTGAPDPFVPPSAPGPRPPAPAEPIEAASATPRDLVRAPPTPPPRLA